ncbi:helix-turn-helix domain-containing protein [Amycolatopsis alkalitolerans]|uniref:GntR family transcriptional regulator n=1 Tax=Amycolatopsis alkalitolerans TaxID=2547244 RepID=UPI001F47E567|nr:GntR family transcriptional regulator [Amycolatopsis alkalitolerans]
MTEFRPDEVVGYIYEQMYEHLAARIESGDLAANTQSPPEQRLATECGVSLGRRVTPPASCAIAAK